MRQELLHHSLVFNEPIAVSREDDYGGREMHSVFALSDFRKRIPKMDWWPRDAFRIRIIRFSKTDSLSKRILKMDSL